MSLSGGNNGMLVAKGLTKKLGGREILKDVNLVLHKKSITGLVGANGAGKTTLIKCLTGIYRPDEGQVTLEGREICSDSQARARIGYVADEGNLFPHYRVQDMVAFYRGIYPAFDRERFVELNRVFELHTDIAVRSLSKGQKTCLALMLNLSVKPDYLLLDEPASGLDPYIKRELFRTLLGEVETRDVGILISSHHVDDLERLCDRVALVGQGKLLQADSVDEMKRSLHKLQVAFNGDCPADLDHWDGIVCVERVGKLIAIIGNDEPENMRAKLLSAGAAHVVPVEMTLEEMMIYRMKEAKKSC